MECLAVARLSADENNYLCQARDFSWSLCEQTLLTISVDVLITASWKDRWVQSKHKSDYGTFDWTAGKFYGDAEKDKGGNFQFMHACSLHDKHIITSGLSDFHV